MSRVPGQRPGLSWRVRLLLLAGLIGVLAIYGGSVLLSTTRDRVDQIDTAPVEAAAVAACTALRVNLDARPAMPPAPSDGQRSARVDDDAALVTSFVEQVQRAGDAALDADAPARVWLADWQMLIDARRAFAASGFVGTFSVPVADGQPITRRMNDIGVDACQVPRSLVDSP